MLDVTIFNLKKQCHLLASVPVECFFQFQIATNNLKFIQIKFFPLFIVTTTITKMYLYQVFYILEKQPFQILHNGHTQNYFMCCIGLTGRSVLHFAVLLLAAGFGPIVQVPGTVVIFFFPMSTQIKTSGENRARSPILIA